MRHLTIYLFALLTCCGFSSRSHADTLQGSWGVSTTGYVSASTFYGDGSNLTNLPSMSGSSISSGTTEVTANNNGYISLTTGGTTTGYFDTSGRLVAPGISLTTANGISSTNGYFSGNVGIGTTTPEKKLHIKATDSSAGLMIERTTASIAAPVLVFRKSRNGAVAQAGDGLANLFISDYINSSTLIDNWFLSVFATETRTATAAGNSLYFRTVPNGSATGLDRMFIGNDGNIGIGTTTPAYTLDIITANNYMRLGDADSTGETLLGNGTNTTGYYAPSFYGRPINAARNTTILSEILTADDTSTNPALVIGSRVTPSTLISTRPTVAFRNNTRTDMQIMADGKVGIATTSPQTALHVSGTLRIADGGDACDANRAGALKYSGGNFYACNGSAWSALGTTAGVVSDRITSNTTGITVQTGGVISITTNGSTANYFDTSGRFVTAGISVTTLNGVSSTNGYFSRAIGIGTTAANATLDVSGSLNIGDGNTRGMVTYSSANGLRLWNMDNSVLTLGTTGAERLRVSADGKVGIGMTAPAYPLDVSGTVRASGEVISTNANQFRMVQGNYGAFWRNDGTNLYLLFTASGDQYGNWNTLRPFTANLTTGAVTMSHGLTVGGNVAATSFSGDGSSLTGVTATNANTLDSLDSTQFVRKDADSDITAGIGIRFGHANQTNTADGMISAGKYASGLNIVGTQTVASEGRIIRLWGNLLDSGGSTYWHAGNDGSGSGLDADAVDGVQAANLLTKAGVTAGNACIGNGTTVDCSDSNVGTKDDITTRTPSGFWQTSTATTGEGWPVTSNNWYHLLTSTHSSTGNHYSMQFAGDFFSSNDIFYRATNGSGTTGWNRLWHSGNDGSGSGLDADTLDGVDSGGFLRREVNTWQTSSEGQPRYYFVSGGRTYFKSANNGDGIAVAFRDSADTDRVLIAHNGNIWSSILGVWLTDWLNQDVKTTANATFNNLYLSGLGDWITNRLGQDVRSGASVNFDIMDAVRLRLGGARYDTPINNGVIRIVPNSSGEFGINIRQASGQTANLLNFFDTGNNTIARVTASGNVAGTGAYTTLSDRRSKHDIADATDVGLATIEALRPRYYVRNGQTERQLGFIAQEVEEVLPIAVTYMDPDKPETSYKAIQSEALVPVLVNAVKELKAENDLQKRQIQELMNKLDDINSRMKN